METSLLAACLMAEMNESEEPPLKLNTAETCGIENKMAVKRKRDLFSNGKTTNDFRKKYYPQVSQTEWNDWHWQMANSISSIEQLNSKFSTQAGEIIAQNNLQLPLRITPYYASLINFGDPSDPIGLSMIPSEKELVRHHGEKSDPLAEEHDMPVEGLVHRYPDRVLLLSTDSCAAYCRYCTRSHIVAKQNHNAGTQIWHKALHYIAQHSEIRDVLVSGGDFLTYEDYQIEYLLSELRSIPHVEIIRIGTKVPVVLPQRITTSLVRILKRYHPLLMSIHFTHPSELTPEVKQACERLSNAGIPLGSQTVLLRNINDNAETMKKLFQKLLTFRVRPYYMYQCDPIPGSEHFRTPVSKGIEIIENLRGHTSGYAVPHYVIDAPGGGGKIPLIPNYFQGTDNGDVVLRNFENNTYRYPDCVQG
jgi:lysine 2,3-aminomutase